MTNYPKGLEETIFAEIEMTTAACILAKFSGLVRESGSEDERIAALYLESFLKKWQVPYTVHEPKLYLSVPKSASITMLEPELKNIKAKAPSASVSTEATRCKAELVYLASDLNLDDKYDPMAKHELGYIKNKIVLMDGYPVSGKVKEFGDAGAVGAVFISPGGYIHEGTCSAIWGSPDLDSIDHEPKIPVLAISYLEGEQLKALSENKKVVIEIQTQLDKGWFTCPLMDIFIEGTEEPEKYVLLHGHLDSWHVGVGDNATGAAALMEMTRLFHKHRDQLKRSIRIAIWPGHSTGRYAGSTWFADEFGVDLDENCFAQVNCDSPGCRWATSYESMNWMSEADEFCKKAILDAVNQPSQGSRPHRAGDYSFNNIGITSFFMLSSTMPTELVKEKGYYPVGGCGGNIQWHSEEDELIIADYKILRKDIKVYMTSLIRAINSTVYPFNYVNTLDEMITTLHLYQSASKGHYSLEKVAEEAKKLQTELIEFYAGINEIKDLSCSNNKVQLVNAKLLQISRQLIKLNYSRQGEFRHDPALDIPPMPDLSAARDLLGLEVESHQYNVTLTHLKRGSNRVIWTLRNVRKLLSKERF
jgi:N-acetylated-alpha-linked acidic dipeptidase